MGREVRMVPENWEHPKDGFYHDGSVRYLSLYGSSFAVRAKEYADNKAAWERGEFPSYFSEKSKKLSFEEYEGEAPKQSDYMPDWPAAERTHLMMYETCSEGSPISPAFKTPEELARWLADNNASAFGSSTASYESWLATCKQGWAISAVFTPDIGLISGVEFTK